MELALDMSLRSRENISKSMLEEHSDRGKQCTKFRRKKKGRNSEIVSGKYGHVTEEPVKY